MGQTPFQVNILRGETIESSHSVMAVVVDAAGKIVETFGDADFLTFPRSAIKMLQALPLLESGAADHYNLNDKEICMACASHNGEAAHIEVVRAWLAKISCNETDLACGPQRPSNEAALQKMYLAGEQASAICNNCSGKHAGFLATCVHLQEKTQGYEIYDHNQQKRLRQVLSETMRIDHDKLVYGIDGCSIVTYATPLKNIAVGMSALINPQESTQRREAAQRILQAVTAEPFYLAGSDDFTSVVNEKTRGRSIVKVGAEGVYAGLIPGRGLALVVKAVDGAKRAAEFSMATLLQKYGGLSEQEFVDLKAFTQPIITSRRGEVVGRIVMAVR